VPFKPASAPHITQETLGNKYS